MLVMIVFVLCFFKCIKPCLISLERVDMITNETCWH